jgi:tetratricopeptide (TPR) repeat protein
MTLCKNLPILLSTLNDGGMNMRCPFCHVELSSDEQYCPMCHKEIIFTAQLFKAGKSLCHEGDVVASRHQYKRAMAFYRAALHYIDQPDIQQRIQHLQKRLASIRLAGFLLIVIAILFMAFLINTKDPKAMSTVNKITEPPYVTVQNEVDIIHLVRTAYMNEQWAKSWSYLKYVNLNDDWRWAMEERSEEIRNRYIADQLEKAKVVKANTQKYHAILINLAQQGLDTSDHTVFRLRRAEGHVLFLRLSNLQGHEREECLNKIFSLFKPKEYRYVYYMDDCLYQLGRIKEEQGQKQSAIELYRLLLDQCPQGQWYWSDTKKRLKDLVASTDN